MAEAIWMLKKSRLTYMTQEPDKPGWKLWSKITDLEWAEWLEAFRATTRHVPGLRIKFISMVWL